jgi:hypothetical protein
MNTTITVQDIPLTCDCDMMSRAIHRPTPEQRIPTCKNKVTRMTIINTGQQVFSCGSHVKTIKTSYRSFIADTFIRKNTSNIFVLPPPPPPTPQTPEQIARTNATIARVERNRLIRLKNMKNVKTIKINLTFDEHSSNTECSICMETIDIGNGGHLHCKHAFHNHCITQWFQIKNNCPYCRTVC